MVVAEKFNESAARLLQQCNELAAISAMPEGILRTYLSVEHKRANQLVAQWMQAAGMNTWQDNVGNQWGRYEGAEPEAPTLLFGSHLDTVPNAGRFDGILGVLAAIELVAALDGEGRRLAFAIEVVGFCDEEGTRFGTTLIGSKALAGLWEDSWLSLKDKDDISLYSALKAFDLEPERCAEAAVDRTRYLGYWEIHIEQGPVLESENLPVGVVTGIAGARRSHIRTTGQAGHSGTTPMHLRRDALAGAAEITVAIEQIARRFGGDVVATVGQVFAKPGAVNVIAGDAIMSLDVRSQNNAIRDQVIEAINDAAEAIVARRRLTLSWNHTHEASAVLCDHHFQTLFAQAIDGVTQKSIPIKFLPSGAGHDAMAMANVCPVAMLFLRSPGGISHHPDEGVIPSDVAMMMAVMTAALDQYALNKTQ